MRTRSGILCAAAAAAAVLVGGLAPASATEATLDPLGYWTEAKVRAAAVIDDPVLEYPDTGSIDPGGDSSDGIADLPPTDVAPEENAGSLRATTSAQLNATVGRLFFRTPSGDASCSAAVVNSASKNLILTAGHCAHQGGAGKSYYGNFLFAPGWHNGPSAHGYWSGTGVAASAEWTQSKKWDHDYAFVRLAANGNGQRIANVVGGHAIATSAGHVHASTHIWGYPARAPYSGNTAYRCETPTVRINSYAPDAKAPCDFTDGASGGPWVKDALASGVGYIWAVTSRCDSGSSGTAPCSALYATPLPEAARTLRDAVGV